MKSLLKWFETKPMTKATLVSAVATVVMAVTSVAMLLSLGLSRHALKVASDALDLQRAEFRLRNRPYIVLKNPQFLESMTDERNVLWPHALALEIHNLSEIPANNVVTKGLLFLNGQEIQRTDTRQTGNVKDDPKWIRISLRSDVYQQIHDVTNMTYATYTTTYSGMLGEPASAYTSMITVIYRPAQNTFEFRDIEIR